MKRLVAAAVAVVLVGLLAGAALQASAGSRAVSTRTIQLFALTVEQKFLDLDARDFTLGDVFVFHDRLFRAGKRVGHDGGVCTVTSVRNPGEANCVVTVSLPGGQITSQGLVSGAEPPQTFILPIRGAQGPSGRWGAT